MSGLGVKLKKIVDSGSFFQRSSLRWFPIIKGLAVTLVCCSRLHAWLSAQSWLVALLSSLVVRWLVGLQTLRGFRLGDLSVDQLVEACYFGCCRSHWGSPVGFLLLRYSALFTVESLSSLYLLFISLFICSRRLCIDKLGVFHANQTSMYLDAHQNKGKVCAPSNGFKPSDKIFLQTVPRRWFFCGSFMFFLSCFLCFHARLFVNPLERADLLALLCDV